MMKLLKNKVLLISISVVLVAVFVVTAVILATGKPSLPIQHTGETPESSADVNIQIPTPSDTSPAGTESNVPDDGTSISVDVGTEDPDSTKTPNPPSVNTEDPQTGTKNPPKSDNTVSTGTGNNPGSNPDKEPTNPPGGVVDVDPVPRGDEPAGASGSKPKATDWVSVNSNVPQELYNYDYTTIEGEDIVIGAQMKWRGYNTWDKAAEATIGGLKQYYSIDYRKIQSVNPNDRDKYLTDLVYWTGESAHMDICDYMQFAIDNKIISTASVVCDGSLMYNNGVQLIRARVYVTWQSGAAAYGLQNGIKYYRDVEVAVYPSTGEDRYGFGKGNDFNVLLYSENCFNFLCAWKKA